MATQFSDLNPSQVSAVKAQSTKWYERNKAHVDSLILESKESVAPSGSDLFRPELWKAIHWRWFLELNKPEASIETEQSPIKEVSTIYAWFKKLFN